jgi:hypothetical protein
MIQELRNCRPRRSTRRYLENKKKRRCAPADENGPGGWFRPARQRTCLGNFPARRKRKDRHSGALAATTECAEDWTGPGNNRRRCANAAVVYARRRTLPACEGLAGLRYDCQGSSATVTNPGLNPADTNANLLTYHQIVNPSTRPRTGGYHLRMKETAIARDPVQAHPRSCEPPLRDQKLAA